MVWLLLVLLLLVVGFAFLAGAGWGSTRTYERLRPERLAKEFHVDAMHVFGEMQDAHNTVLSQLVTSIPPLPVLTATEQPPSPAVTPWPSRLSAS